MLEGVITVPFWVELIASLTGAISGSMHAVKHEYDIFGVISLACVGGLAGGVIRDMLLQDYGIYAFQRWELIIVCIVCAIFVFFFCRLFERLDLPMDILDTISMALFAILGVSKSFAAGYAVLPCAIIGTITAAGGGVMRDILIVREPKIFKSGTLYASAAFIGAFVFALMKEFSLLPNAAPGLCMALILVLRFASMFFHIETRPARDYSDKLEAWIARVRARLAARYQRIIDQKTKDK